FRVVIAVMDAGDAGNMPIRLKSGRVAGLPVIMEPDFPVISLKQWFPVQKQGFFDNFIQRPLRCFVPNAKTIDIIAMFLQLHSQFESLLNPFVPAAKSFRWKQVKRSSVARDKVPQFGKQLENG